MTGAAVFQATCPQCGQVAKFVELRVEACLQPEEGPTKAWYGFRCFACGKRMKEVPGPEGVHRFEEGRHVVAGA